MSNSKIKEIKEMEVKEEVKVNEPEVNEETKLALKPVEEPENEPVEEPEKKGVKDCVVDRVKGFGRGLWSFTKKSLPVVTGVVIGIGGAMLYSYMSFNKEETAIDTEEDVIDGEGQFVDDDTEE